MKENLTEIVILIDESSSMNILHQDIIDWFNAMLDQQKRSPGAVLMSIILFHSQMKTLYDRVPVQSVKPIIPYDYIPTGNKSLLDVLGTIVPRLQKMHKYSPAEQVPEKTLFIVITEGEHDVSQHFSLNEVQQIIKKQQEEGWHFLFLGTKMDVPRQAYALGIPLEMSVEYIPDASGLMTMLHSLNDAINSVRYHKTIQLSWKQKMELDTLTRKNQYQS